jgi:hypothetical protein
MAMLGEHGGPAFARNAYMESYGLQQQLAWAQKGVAGVQNQMNSPWAQYAGQSGGVTGAAMGAASAGADKLNGAIGWATQDAQHAAAAYGLYKLGSGAVSAVGNIGDSLTNWRNLGGQLGADTSGNFASTPFGFNNPFDITNATGIGSGSRAVEESLRGRGFLGIGGGGVGAGLSKDLAQSDVQEIMGQGYGANESATGSSGDITTIAQNLLKPMQTQNNQLTAGDLGQFLPALRNSNTSISQLKDSLSNLGIEAQAAKETIGQFSGSVSTAATAFESMGGSQQQGITQATSFTNATGLDPQIATQLAQNPMMQGMALGQYGVLPSGIAGMNSGAFLNSSSSTLKMLQNGLSGLSKPSFANVDGQRVQVGGGESAVYSQIASMTGLPESIVQRMLGDQKGIQANAKMNELLGDPTKQGTLAGVVAEGKGNMSASQRSHAESLWGTISKDWKGTGIGQKEMDRISKDPSYADRIKRVQSDMATANKNNPLNQIQNDPNAVTIGLTPQAAKIFQVQQGPTAAKKISNAGGTSYNGILNSVSGDTSGNTSSLSLSQMMAQEGQG